MLTFWVAANRANGISVPKIGDATPNPPREALDLYTPRFVKGKGTTKVCRHSSHRGVEILSLCRLDCARFALSHRHVEGRERKHGCR